MTPLTGTKPTWATAVPSRTTPIRKLTVLSSVTSVGDLPHGEVGVALAVVAQPGHLGADLLLRAARQLRRGRRRRTPSPASAAACRPTRSARTRSGSLASGTRNVRVRLLVIGAASEVGAVAVGRGGVVERPARLGADPRAAYAGGGRQVDLGEHAGRLGDRHAGRSAAASRRSSRCRPRAARRAGRRRGRAAWRPPRARAPCRACGWC